MVFISILNYLSPAATSRCINVFHDACSGLPHQFIVRDHSPNSEVEQIRAELTTSVLELVLLRHSPDNPGFGTGHNRNFRECPWQPSDTFLILNNDVELSDPDLVAEMFKQCTRRTLLGCVIRTGSTGDVWFAGATVNPLTGDVKTTKTIPHQDMWKTQVLCGCCIMIQAGDFAALGGFDERFFMYAEDLDLSLRACKRGFRLLVLNRNLYHVVGSGQRGQYSSLYLYENTKNRLICLRTHRMGWPFLRETYFFLKYFVARTFQLAIFSTSPIKQSRTVLRAFLDAVRSL